MKKCFVLLIFVMIISAAFAQRKVARNTFKLEKSLIQMYEDTLGKIHNKYFATLDSLNNDTVPERFIESNPRYYRLFVPFTYYYSPVEQAFDPKWEPQSLKEVRYPVDSLFPININKFNETKRLDRRINKVLLDTYVAYPGLIVATEKQISSRKQFQKQVVEKLPPKIHVVELFKPDPIETNVGDVDLYIRKPNFWVTGGNGSFQLTQNYISENWYKGGESNNAVLSHLQLFANYNDKKKLQFENMLEAKLGFNSVPSDTIHKYLVNTDVLRVTSKLGIQAATNWYYTLSAEFNTQFCRGYKANSDQVVSAFMSPANLVFALGMDYKLNKKKLNLSVIVSPGAYNMRYVGSEKVDETKFGLDKGDHFLHDIGSKLETKITWKIIPSITYDSRLYYFTNYEKVEAEWENTFNFVLNRFLSTKLFIHARFDDSVKPTGDHSYFQLKELLSFGINYKW